jgi:hypothetical protein
VRPPTGDGHPQAGEVPEAPTRRRLLLVLCGVALIAWCGWVSGFHRSTTLAEVTWVVSLVTIVATDLLLWQGRHRRHPGLRLEPASEPWPRPCHGPHAAMVGLSPWLGLSLIVLAWDILGIDTGTHEPHLTISALTEAFRPLNAAMLLVWLLVGIGYGTARARAPVVAAPPPSRRDRPGPTSAVAVALMHPSVTVPVVVATPALLLPANRGVGVAFWVAVVVAAVVVEFIAPRSRGRIADAEELVRYITAPLAANVLLVVAWTFAGYHLFAR